MKTPVALIIFIRPDHTQRVFNVIAQAKPDQLFIIADGPRNQEEYAQCQATRNVVAQIDWDCEVHRNYADENMGLKHRISSGLDWVFKQVETAIILEDDCVPDPSFFRFCEELLDYYVDDPRVMHITGDNFGYKPKNTEVSYYFTRYIHVWGWATWRRAWKQFDIEMKAWSDPVTKEAILLTFKTKKERDYWSNLWDKVVSNEIDTWDYSWFFACLLQNGLSIMPTQNLVTNIGFGEASTNTKEAGNHAATHNRGKMRFPILHPKNVVQDTDADQYTSRMLVYEHSLLNRIRRRLLKFWT